MSGKGKDCIARALEAGLLDEKRAKAAIRKIEEIEFQYWDALGPIGARKQANMDVMEMVKRNASDRKRAAMFQLLAQDRIIRQLSAAQAAQALPDRASLLGELVDNTGAAGKGFRGAVQEHRRVRSLAHRMMNEALKKFHHAPFGISRNKAQLVNVLKEIKGEATGDVMARQMAQAWTETAESLRKMYNAVGGAIPKLKGWDLPQHHNVMKVRKETFETWRDTVVPLLDRDKMLDHGTGKVMTDAQLEEVLKSVHANIRTKGWDGIEPTAQVSGNPIAMRHRESRVLHWQDSEAWLKYNERFGEGDVFSAMMLHIDSLSREIGAMRALGPNPRATLRLLGQKITKAAHENGDAKMINRAEREAQRVLTLYSHYIGDANAPVDGRFARAFSSTRQFLTAAQLGSAVLSAVTDVAFTRITARFNGLSSLRLMRKQLKLLNPASGEDRQLAVRLGLIAEEWSNISSSQMRYTGEVISGEISRRLSDGVLRVSGLNAWTQAGRWAFGMEFMGTLADHAGKNFDALDGGLRKSLTRYGIHAGEWDVIRATPMYEHKGAKFLRPDDIMSRPDVDGKQADALATKLLDMIQSETEFAVPSSSVRGKAMIIGDAKPGTVEGELIRSTLMYKNFAITLMFTHMRRMLDEQGAWNKFKYGGDLVVSTTLMGAFALLLKDISRGKDPRPMASDKIVVDPKFLGAAMMQGGGLGIFGDFLLADQSRFGMSGAATLAGPISGFTYDTLKLGQQVATNADTRNRTAIQYAGRYTPGSSLWYLRYGIERGLLDTLQRWADPGAEDSFKAMRVSRGTEQGADFFAPRGGGLLPERGPDFANMLRTHEEGKVAAQARRNGVNPDGAESPALLEAIKSAQYLKRKGVPVKNMKPAEVKDLEARTRAGVKKRRKQRPDMTPLEEPTKLDKDLFKNDMFKLPKGQLPSRNIEDRRPGAPPVIGPH